jgi:multidrug efflux pump subunit AcrB/outer membrane protein TolC
MRGLIQWLVDHTTTVLLAVLVVFAAGLFSYITLPRESNPDISLPVVIVTTPYTGVSPEDVESLITIPVENEISSLRDIKKLNSTSAEGVSITVVEFEPEVVVEDVLQKVRDRVSRARSELPDDVDESTVSEISFSDIPVLLITVAGGLDEEGLKELAEALEEDAKRIPGVLDTTVTGGIEREIQVQVIPERIGHYGLSIRDVAGAISDENVNIPGGNVAVGRGDFLLRVPGEFIEPRQIESVAVKRVGERPVFVRDVARVVDTYKDRETYSRMGGQPSVTLSVTKRAGSNILEVAEGLKGLVAEHSQDWPPGVEYRVLGDQSANIRSTVNELQNNIITALILVVGVLVFAMGLRNSLFVALAIPLSMLGSMLVLDSAGFTLNMVVLFSLIMALGMLVDNGIVVVENIYRHAEMGKSRTLAAVDGTAEVAVAVAASTATTVAAFGPLALWTGVIGEFMGYLPKTIITVLVASLVVAIVVLPVAMSRLMPANVSRAGGVDSEYAIHRELGPVMRFYQKLLKFSIRFRYLSAALVTASLLVTAGIYGLFNHGTEFMPDTEPDRARVGVQAAQGTDVETTDRIVREVEAVLARTPNIDTWVAQTGVSAGGDALAGSSARPNEARITVDFPPHPNNWSPGESRRVADTRDTISDLRADLAMIPGARIAVDPEMMGPPVGKPIEILVSGDELDAVGAFALDVMRQVSRLQGVTALENDYKVGRPEMRLVVDRGAAKRVGVSTAAVGDAVRSAIAGVKASALRDGDNEHDIIVQLAPEYRSDLQSVLGLRLPGREDRSPDTFPVPISTVASYELVGGSGSIQHVDQDLVVTITGDVLYGFNENDVRAEVLALVEGIDAPAGMALSLGGADQEQQESAAFLGRAFAIAVALIMMVLVTQFDSLSMPLIIIFTVILSLTGVLWGLLLTGTPFSVIMTGIGVISLAGVVVNNAIVLLDYVQQLLERGFSVEDALVEAGLTRFRPVVLTAITTTLGLVPMAIGVSLDFLNFKLNVGGQSAEWWGPMAVAVIFGLTFATLLTLVMVPTFYSINDDFTRLVGRVFSRSTAGAPEPSGQVADAIAKVLLAGVFGSALLVSTPARALTFEQAVTSAEQNSISLQLAREQLNQTLTLRGKAWSTIQPRVSARATRVFNQYEAEADFGGDFAEGFEDYFAGLEDAFGGALELPELDTSSSTSDEPLIPQNFWQAEVAVSQRLFSGTAVPLLNGAYATAAAGRATYERERRDTRLRVAQVYYQLYTSRQAIALSEAGLLTAENQLELASRQVEAGVTDARARIQAELAVARAKRDLDRSLEGLVSAEQSFSIVTGLEGVPGALELPPPPAVPLDVEVAVNSSKGRQDVVAAQHQARAARFNRRGKTAEWLPLVDGQFTYNYDEGQVFLPEPWFWRLSLSATWSLWSGGMRLAERREASAQLRASELQVLLAKQTAEQEVRVAFEAYRRASAGLTAMDDELRLARENLRLAELGFQSGSTTWLEVEQADLVVRSAELTSVQERMARDLAALELVSSSGGL